MRQRSLTIFYLSSTLLLKFIVFSQQSGYYYYYYYCYYYYLWLFIQDSHFSVWNTAINVGPVLWSWFYLKHPFALRKLRVGIEPTKMSFETRHLSPFGQTTTNRKIDLICCWYTYKRQWIFCKPPKNIPFYDASAYFYEGSA